MFYTGKVNWYSEFTEKVVDSGFFLVADNFKAGVGEQGDAGFVVGEDVAIDLMQLQHLKHILLDESDGLGGVVHLAVLGVNQDADAGTPVERVEVENVNDADSLPLVQLFNHQSKLLAGINVLRCTCNVLFQCELRKWCQRVADGPDGGVVFPAIEQIHIVGLECAQPDFIPF